MNPRHGNARTRTLLLESFGAIAMLLVLSQVLAYLQWRNVQHAISVVDENALTSIHLIGRIGNDVQRERVLVDRHIFEHDVSKMTEVEGQIAALQRDHAEAARAYAPLASFAGEAITWYDLVSEIASAERVTLSALELSRQGHDPEAAQLILTSEPTFDSIARRVSDLIHINRAAADHARVQMTEMQIHLLEVGIALAAAVLALTFVVGLYVTRVISRAERELLQRTDDLEAKNRELDAFAGRVAHDLRGPLNTLDLTANVIAQRLPEDSGTTAILRRGIHQMTRLLEDMLQLSRTSSVSGEVAHTETLVASVAADVGPLVEDVGGTLHTEVQAAAVACSEGLLRQVLWNLCDNALKYRRPDVPPEIAIVGRVDNSEYLLHVTDNGLGMSADEARRSFEPFFRGERARAVPGTGLGLAIVRRVVDACGGSVLVDSQPNHGTTFAIRLRIATAP